MSSYNPGPAVTVGELEVGDTVFLQSRQTMHGPILTHPTTVNELIPLATGHVRVYVKSANAGATIAPRLLGDLPATREFRRAIPGD